MSANVLLFNDLHPDSTLMPDLHEAPIMYRNGEFRYVECITDSVAVADTAAEIGYEIVEPTIQSQSLFFVISTDIPVLF